LDGAELLHLLDRLRQVDHLGTNRASRKDEGIEKDGERGDHHDQDREVDDRRAGRPKRPRIEPPDMRRLAEGAPCRRRYIVHGVEDRGKKGSGKRGVELGAGNRVETIRGACGAPGLAVTSSFPCSASSWRLRA